MRRVLGAAMMTVLPIALFGLCASDIGVWQACVVSALAVAVAGVFVLGMKVFDS